MIDWNKGKAVEFLLESLALGNSDDVLPIYVGDDRTDEDAFKVIFTQSAKSILYYFWIHCVTY